MSINIHQFHSPNKKTSHGFFQRERVVRQRPTTQACANMAFFNCDTKISVNSSEPLDKNRSLTSAKKLEDHPHPLGFRNGTGIFTHVCWIFYGKCRLIYCTWILWVYKSILFVFMVLFCVAFLLDCLMLVSFLNLN